MNVPFTKEQEEYIILNYGKMPVKEIAKHVNRNVASVKNKAYRLKLLKHVMTRKKESLCWKCKNAYGRCNWSRFFKPVSGWDAEPTIQHYTNGCKRESFTLPSFIVHKCPQFMKG